MNIHKLFYCFYKDRKITSTKETQTDADWKVYENNSKPYPPLSTQENMDPLLLNVNLQKLTKHYKY
jgi:hypothetical protein